MIDESGTARLAEFGIRGVMMDPTDESVTLKLRGSNRVSYMAPELLIRNGNPTKE